jgi:hypothetical protein
MKTYLERFINVTRRKLDKVDQKKVAYQNPI